MGYPNVRAAAEPTQTNALNQRYENAVKWAGSGGAIDNLTAFEDAVSRSSAVVNVDLFFLKEFITDTRALYTTYQLAVGAQTRQAAEDERDRHRSAVDAILFGSYASQIRFAALSLDGRGLKSYGAYAMILRDVAVWKRSTVLEENSFAFVKRHELKPGDSAPAGYRAIWQDRKKLAIAKLGALIKSDTSGDKFASLLLYSDGVDRTKDEFIEVQIFGPFNSEAIEAVCGSSSCKRSVDTSIAVIVKEMTTNGGKSWIEE